MPDPLTLWVVAYDISHAGRSARVRDILRFRGTRVRSCVYEVLCSRSALRRLLDELAFLLEPEDRVRVYRVCQDCREQTFLFGGGSLPHPPAAIIV